MPDDKTKTDARDRNTVAGGHEYEVEPIAKHSESLFWTMMVLIAVVTVGIVLGVTQ
jgi:hypothetical protein